MKIYYYTEERGKVECRRVGLLSYLGHWFLKGVKLTPGIVQGEALLYDFLPRVLPTEVRVIVISFMAALVSNTLVFCNGWMLALYWKGNSYWKLIYYGCLVYVINAAGTGAYMLLAPHFPRYPVYCSVASMWIGILVYLQFRFMRDEAPVACIWFYKAGLRTAE